MMYTQPKTYLNLKSKEFLNRFWLGLFLTLLVCSHIEKLAGITTPFVSSSLQFIFVTPIIAWCGWPIYKKDSFLLLSIGIISLYLCGVLILFFFNSLPEIFKISESPDFLFKISALVTTLTLLEEILEIHLWKELRNSRNKIELMPAPIETLSGRLCNWVTAIVLIIAFLTLVISDKEVAFISAVCVLLIACTRTITLAPSLALLAGIKCAFRSGIYIKSTASLEQLQKIEILVVGQDSLRGASTGLAVKLLHANGMRLVMVTKEDFERAKNFAYPLGIESIESDTADDHKRKVVDRLRQQGFVVAVTDKAEENYAMSLEVVSPGDDKVSRIQFVNNDVAEIVLAVLLSKKVVRNIWINLLLTFFYNLICIPLAAGLLYAWYDVVINPLIIAILMLTFLVLVTLNAFRLEKLTMTIPQ